MDTERDERSIHSTEDLFEKSAALHWGCWPRGLMRLRLIEDHGSSRAPDHRLDDEALVREPFTSETILERTYCSFHHICVDKKREPGSAASPNAHAYGNTYGSTNGAANAVGEGSTDPTADEEIQHRSNGNSITSRTEHLISSHFFYQHFKIHSSIHHLWRNSSFLEKWEMKKQLWFEFKLQSELRLSREYHLISHVSELLLYIIMLMILVTSTGLENSSQRYEYMSMVNLKLHL